MSPQNDSSLRIDKPRSPEADGAEASLADWSAELADRLESGESIDIYDYLRAHPQRTDDLERLFPTIAMMPDLGRHTVHKPEAIPDRHPPLEPGHEVLGDFRIIRQIGMGGMGVVYEAEQISLGRRVALKVLSSAAALDSRQLQRFHLEAQAVASLNHENIVPIYLVGQDRNVPFHAMKLIEGRSLAQIIRVLRGPHTFDSADTGLASERDESAPTHLLREGQLFTGAATCLDILGANVRLEPTSRGRLSVCHGVGMASFLSRHFIRTAAGLGRQAAEALAHAHDLGVVHRDVKPGNLLIDKRGHLWITDFGLARLGGASDLTLSGEVVGTLLYMSPEQAMGTKRLVDHRTDIYSLGATLYELLTLRPAHSGENRDEVLRRIIHVEPHRPRQLAPNVPVDLETIVLKAMSKEPAERYATARDLATDLERFLEDRPILARRPSLASRAVKWSRRHRSLVAGLAALAGLIGLTLAVGIWQYTVLLRDHNNLLQAEINRADRHAQEAEHHRRRADSHAYAADLRLAQQAIETRQLETAQNLLDSIEVEPDGDDPRDFAWHYLRRLARRELTRLPEREFDLHGMSLTRDGKTLAALYLDSTIVLWDMLAQRPRLTVSASPDGVWHPRLTSDGRLLAAKVWSQGKEGEPELAIWDARTGELRSRKRIGSFDSSKQPDAITFLNDERFVAYTRRDKTGRTSVRILKLDFDAGERQQIGTLDGLDAVGFADEGPLFAVCEGGRISLREVATGALQRVLPGTHAGVRVLSFSPDGRLLAAALPGEGVILWDTADGIRREHFDPGDPIVQLVFGPQGKSLAAVEKVGLVHLWNRSTGRERVVRPDALERDRDQVRVSFSNDGKYLATAAHGDPGGHQPVAVWEIATGRLMGTLPCRSQNPSCLFFTPDSRSLIVNLDRAPRIWHFEPSPMTPSPAGHTDEAWAAAFSPDGKFLATGSDDTDEPQTIKLWDAKSGQLRRGWNGGEGTTAALAFSPDGRTIATGHLTTKDNVRLWDAATGDLLAALSGHTDSVRTVAFSPDGFLLASAGRDRTVRLWDLATRRAARHIEGHTGVIRRLAFSRDGQTLATGSSDQTIRLWDVAKGTELRTRRCLADIVALVFAPDGATIATADDVGAITIRDAASLEVLKTIRGDSDELLDLAISPDGRLLASSGISGVIRLWGTVTFQEQLTLTGHRSQVNGIAFAPDGLSLASCSHDGEVKLWRASP